MGDAATNAADLTAEIFAAENLSCPHAGAPRRLVKVETQTKLRPGKRIPAGVEMRIEDETGATHAVRGELMSYMAKLYGQNCVSDTCFMKWTYGEHVGYGEMLLVYDNEHLYRMQEAS